MSGIKPDDEGFVHKGKKERIRRKIEIASPSSTNLAPAVAILASPKESKENQESKAG